MGARSIFLAFIPILVLAVTSLSVPAFADKPKQIDISWRCVSTQIEARYPCPSSAQRLRFFKDGRVILQEKGVICQNELANDRKTYDAFINKSARGTFVCQMKDFDFEISYSTNVKSSGSDFSYTIKGSLKEKLRPGGVSTGQKLTFTTRVRVEYTGANCYATRSYRFSESFNGIPRINEASYNYVSSSCSRS